MVRHCILRGKAVALSRQASHSLPARRHLKCCLQYVSGEAIFTVN
jgi:hypothetical protein